MQCLILFKEVIIENDRGHALLRKLRRFLTITKFGAPESKTLGETHSPFKL